MTTCKARVEPDIVVDGVAIHLAISTPGGMDVVQPLDLTTAVADPATRSEPALRLPDGLAQALLDALARHYGGAVDARTMRSDLLAERARVDKLTDAVIQVATRDLAQGVTP